jgi:hypothetical protein
VLVYDAAAAYGTILVDRDHGGYLATGLELSNPSCRVERKGFGSSQI